MANPTAPDVASKLSDPQLIWSFIQEIGAEERHFNELQSKYRSMAAGWILACFSGIWAVWSHAIQVGIDRLLVIGGIGFAGALGLSLLWRLDALVYHPLLEACFAEGFKLENRHAWLPALRTNMTAVTSGAANQRVLSNVVWFYVSPLVVFALVATGGLVWYVWPSPLEAVIVGGAGAGLTLWVASGMKRKTEAISDVCRNLREGGDDPAAGRDRPRLGFRDAGS